MRRWHTIVIGVIISMVALYFAFRQANFTEMIEAFRHARYQYVALAFLMLFITVGFRGWRWTVLTQGRLSFWDSYWLFSIGFLFNNVLPARLGEIARSVLAGRRPRMHFTSAISSVVVERLFDMVGVVVLIGTLLLVLDLPGWARTAGAAMGLVALIGIIVLAIAARYPDSVLRIGSRMLGVLPRINAERAEHFLRPFVHGLAGVSDWRVFAGGMALSIAAWVFSGVTAWVLMFAFWPDPDFIGGLLAVAAAGLGISIPAAPSGIGPFEWAVVGTFTAVGYDESRSGSFALTLHMINFLVTSLLGMIGLMREGVTFREVARAAESAQHEPIEPPRTEHENKIEEVSV